MLHPRVLADAWPRHEEMWRALRLLGREETPLSRHFLRPLLGLSQSKAERWPRTLWALEVLERREVERYWGDGRTMSVWALVRDVPS